MAQIVEMPKLGFDMAEGTLAAWVKSENDTIEKGEVIAEIETDKATVEVESSFSGIVHKHLAKEGDALPVGTPIAVIAEEGEEVDLDALLDGKSGPADEAEEPAQEEPAEESTESHSEQKTESQRSDGERIFISPVAERLAEDNGIDITTLTGSGPNGRIVKRDVEEAIKSGGKQTTFAKKSASITPGKDETIEISKLRAAIGRRMTESRQNIPHFFITHSYNVAELLKTRKQLNAEVSDEERVSVNDFIVRATALALRDFPEH